MNESIIQELFKEIQPKLEAVPAEEMAEITRRLTSFIVNIIQHKLAAAKNPRELIIILGLEFEHGMVSCLANLPLEEADEELDKLLTALREDIKNGIERGRRTFPL